MKFKFGSLLLSAALLMVAMPQARASEGDWDGLFVALYSYSLTVSTFLPIIVTGNATSCGCNGYPMKEAYLKVTSIEAAAYVAGGEMGPNLAILMKANPDKSADDIIDTVLEAAQGL